MNDWLLRMPEWLCRILQPGEDNRRWRELLRGTNDFLRKETKQARSRGLPADAPLRWMEWHRMNIAGRDAYYHGRHEEAHDRFERLITITKEIGDPPWMRLDHMTD